MLLPSLGRGMSQDDEEVIYPRVGAANLSLEIGPETVYPRVGSLYPLTYLSLKPLYPLTYLSLKPLYSRVRCADFVL